MGELWGITGDGWVAIATFFGGVAMLASAAVVFFGIQRGAQQVLNEQEARDVRRYYVDDGLWRLSGSFDAPLKTIRENYATALHLVRVMRDLPANRPGAPRVEDLARLVLVDRRDVAFRAIRPASDILGFPELGQLLTRAFATLLSVHEIFVTEVELSIRSYYAGAVSLDDDRRAALVKKLFALSDRRYFEAEEFQVLPHILEAAGLRLQKLRVSRFDEVDEIVGSDPEIRALKEKLRELWEKIKAKTDEKEGNKSE